MCGSARLSHQCLPLPATTYATMPSLAKSASLVITLAGGLIHSFLTLQLAGSWQSLRALDAESDLDAWKLDGLRVLWGLLAMYLLAAAFVSFVGFFGVLRVSGLCFVFVFLWCVVFSSAPSSPPPPSPSLETAPTRAPPTRRANARSSTPRSSPSRASSH
ncbi:hypothetical protein C8F04DRAFT_1102497 [Mycena alexandri]|uniref:Uncharacterized protein n=1 Tax=Mycena alexandri TaxID=1745969 RepID=A0AAD6X450_9AGAR|nr:hypothetical protein C8F04DRAFT_1102497 [Mycena alexandri]